LLYWLQVCADLNRKKIILFSTARDLYIVDTQQVHPMKKFFKSFQIFCFYWFVWFFIGWLICAKVPQRLRRIESLINTPSDVPIDPSLSPDASFVAFIRYSDIWINHIESGKEVRLTWSNPGFVSLLFILSTFLFCCYFSLFCEWNFFRKFNTKRVIDWFCREFVYK
jgi:hypothetical protein